MSKKIIEDPRFNKVFNDPIFTEVPKRVKKIEIKDDRFKNMFTDKQFSEKLDFDEYGRKKIKKNFNTDLKRYYMLDDDNQEENRIDNNEENEIDDGESDTSEEFQEFLKEYQEGVDEDDPFQELDQNEILNGEETNRIAVMNIDWENFTALDLFVLFSSFCKGKMKIEKVEIYPSEFGIKEIEKEKLNGPDFDIFEERHVKDKEDQVIHDLNDLIEDDIKDEYKGFDQIKLRKYELKKLKYNYGVIYCDSKKTGLLLYNMCDGMEIEKTQCFMDLRFIPDSLKEFPYQLKDVCNHIPNEYEPKFSMNRALQHSKVKLTWDTNNHKREELISKAFTKEQFNQDEINQLLVSSDTEDDDDARELNELLNDVDETKHLNLLGKKKNKELNIKDGETITISFNKGFEGINTNEKVTSRKDKSLWEKYIEKKKNKRREKKEEEKIKREEKKFNRKGLETSNKKQLGLLVDDSLKNKKFKVNNSDDRFKAIGHDSKFAIDPTNKEFKKAKK